jgi:hypothetical protein
MIAPPFARAYEKGNIHGADPSPGRLIRLAVQLFQDKPPVSPELGGSLSQHFTGRQKTNEGVNGYPFPLK